MKTNQKVPKISYVLAKVTKEHLNSALTNVKLEAAMVESTKNWADAGDTIK
jgi:hypothetical protein